MANDLVRAARFDERGMATAEYAVGTLAVVGFVGVIMGLSQQEWFKEIIRKIFQTLADLIIGWMQSMGV